MNTQESSIQTRSGTKTLTTSNDSFVNYEWSWSYFGYINYDIVDGNSGNDKLIGSLYTETFWGSAGNDTLAGWLGDDILTGGLGNDAIYGNGSEENWFSALVTDFLSLFFSSSDDDELYGNNGQDTLKGGNGDDRLDGGFDGSVDSLSGGDGNDIYIIDENIDVIAEALSKGNQDTVLASLTFGLPQNVENLTLTGAATINGTGNVLNNFMRGNDAHNSLNGKDGVDSIYGNAGNDTLVGGMHEDILNGGEGDDSLAGGDQFTAETLSFNGNDKDTLSGGLGNDQLYGGADGDVLYGDNSGDTVNGGNDTLVGGIDKD
ncbi:MAG: calcium-binding protein, partial [Methylovulum sp.]